MGGLCGKNYHKRPAEALVSNSNQNENLVQQQKKPSVHNPYLDNSKHDSENQDPKKNSQSPMSKFKNESPQKSPDINKSNKQNQEFELKMSPEQIKSTFSDRNKGNIIKESEHLTPQIVENPKSTAKGDNEMIVPQNLTNPLFEVEKMSLLETGEFIKKELFGEDDFNFLDELIENIKKPQNGNPENIPKIICPLNLLEPKEIEANGFDIDLFEEMPTFEPEDDEESLKKSDLQELNSSGIQYKENQYGKIFERKSVGDTNLLPNINNDQREIEQEFHEEIHNQNLNLERKLEFSHAILEENYEDSPDLRSNYIEDSKTFNKPMENLMEPKFHENKMGNFDVEDGEEEEEKKENNEILNDFNDFGVQENDYGGSQNESEEEGTFGGNKKKEKKVVYDTIKLEVDNEEKLDEQFFLNQVNMDELNEEEEKEREEMKNAQESVSNQIDPESAEYEMENDFSYDQITPTVLKERMEASSNSASMRKKLQWWSSNKKK